MEVSLPLNWALFVSKPSLEHKEEVDDRPLFIRTIWWKSICFSQPFRNQGREREREREEEEEEEEIGNQSLFAA